MSNFEFQNSWFFLLFLLFLPLLYRDLKKNKRTGIKVPTIQHMGSASMMGWVLTIFKLSKYLILSLIIIALARPRTFTVSQDKDETKGVDIFLTVDTSLSMLSKDLTPDRLTALQDIAVKFVQKRPNDRIGLVTYAAEAFTKVPITSDHEVVIDELKNIDPLELTPGTAIGEGLSVAVNHLRNSQAKSKIIILMTDGVNNVENAIPPLLAAELAKNNDIKVYSIGIGSNGIALMPTQVDRIFGDLIFTEVEVQIDEELLRNIARETRGKYFRATSNTSLEQIYDEINSLEKTDLKVTKLYNYEEYFIYFLYGALGILLLDAVLRWWAFKILS